MVYGFGQYDPSSWFSEIEQVAHCVSCLYHIPTMPRFLSVQHGYIYIYECVCVCVNSFPLVLNTFKFSYNTLLNTPESSL